MPARVVWGVLLQNGKEVSFISKSFSPVQISTYAQIEKEMAAIVFALERFHSFTYCNPNVEIFTDHKPLIAIHNKSLSSAPKRLQRMLLRLLKVFQQSALPFTFSFITNSPFRSPSFILSADHYM